MRHGIGVVLPPETDTVDFQGSKVSESLGRDREQTRMLPQHSLHLPQVTETYFDWNENPMQGHWRVLALPFSFSLLLKRRCWVSTSDFLPLPPRTVPEASQGPGRRLKRTGDLNRESEQKNLCHFEFFAPSELKPLRASIDLQFQPLWVARRPSPLHPSSNSSSLCWGDGGSPHTLTEARYIL